MTTDLLGAIAEVIMGQSPPGETCNEVGEGLPLLNGPTEFGPHHPTPVQFTTDARKRAAAGDILFCVRGSTTGRMNWADREYAIGRGIAAIRHNQGGEYQHFLRGLIDFRLPELLAQATGSTFPNISYDQLVGLVCDLPSQGEQRTIARLLGELDGKIELNAQINKTLDAMGRAIFKRWFIDFEFPSEEGKPYRSSGREMVHNKESGKEIPKGWKIAELGRLIKFAKGRKPKDVSRTPVKGYEPQILIETLNNENFVYANAKGMVDVSKVDPIMVMDGASSGRVEIGHEGILGSTLSKIVRTTDMVSDFFVYYFLKANERDINENTTGTSIPHADKQRIGNYLVVLPAGKTLQKFDGVASKMTYRIIANKNESTILSQIRGTLLPKLMAGRVRIPVEVR